MTSETVFDQMVSKRCEENGCYVKWLKSSFSRGAHCACQCVTSKCGKYFLLVLVNLCRSHIIKEMEKQKTGFEYEETLRSGSKIKEIDQ